jgi:hypothetical protein
MKTRLTVLLLAAGLALGGCGLVGAAAPTPTPSVRDRAVAAWTAAIQCVRDHGWSVPDPAIDDQGNATFPSEVGKPPSDVIAACQHFLDALPNQNANNNANAPTADDIRLGRQFAACLRTNGEPSWPDPNADGTFPATPQMEAEGKSPTLVAAVQACGRYLPSGHIFFSQPSSGG